MFVLDLLGGAASGVMTQNSMSAVLQTESIMSGWMARRHPTWHPAITMPYLPACLPLLLSGEWVVLVWLHSLLPNRWVVVCLCTFNDCCLIIIPHQGTLEWGETERDGGLQGYCFCSVQEMAQGLGTWDVTVATWAGGSTSIEMTLTEKHHIYKTPSLCWHPSRLGLSVFVGKWWQGCHVWGYSHCVISASRCPYIKTSKTEDIVSMGS